MSSIFLVVDDASCRPSIFPDQCPLVAIYISTDLRVIMMRGNEAQNYARDLRQRDSDRWRIYRRLDLNYWAWLNSRMPAAEQAHADGRINSDVLAGARNAIALCEVWIQQIYTKQQISVAISNTKTYQPPAKIAA